jgi:coatomer subunit delta
MQVDGEWRYDSRRGMLLWTVDMIDDANRSGAMEFVTPASDSDSFFPIEISFSATRTFCEVEIEAVEQTQTHAPVKFSSTRVLQTVLYQVV